MTTFDTLDNNKINEDVCFMNDNNALARKDMNICESNKFNYDKYQINNDDK